ncbi:hypothetical protein [Candidatus Ruminimicrobium bovinum]|uniref:hypothetical protein n=1 Tax=Candidatus Ruminimicrobium bovinum TaxID=3242779 RepID=UPI0039B87BBA
MADQFNRLAQHFSNYWKDKGENAPVINFDTKQIERTAEQAFRSAAEGDAPSKETNVTEKGASKPKEKGLNLAGMFADVDDMIEKAVENKIKRILDRIIDDKLRSEFSNDFSLFEKSMANKIQEKVKSISPKVLEGLKTVSPDVGKGGGNKAPTSFTEGVMEETEDEVVDKTASVEVFPGIFIKASQEDKSVGEVFIKTAGTLQKMNYVINLPETNSKKEYIEQLQNTLESI